MTLVIGSKDTAKAHVRLGLGLDVDAKKMAQHGHDGCSLVVYRSFSTSCFLVVVDCEFGGHLPPVQERALWGRSWTAEVADASSSDADGRCTKGGGYTTARQFCMIQKSFVYLFAFNDKLAVQDSSQDKGDQMARMRTTCQGKDVCAQQPS
jgi:hypothetical protein